jgi:signal transduction histidine kinase/CheY-like chemotaxis protein
MVFLVVVCAFGYLLLDSQSRQRHEAEQRFQTRAVVSATMTDSLFASASGQQQQAAAKAFSGPTLDTRRLVQLVRQSRYRYALVLDARGNLLATSSATAGRLHGQADRTSAHVRGALAGQPYLSGLLPGAQRGSAVIEWALPFESRRGRRVMVVALPTKQISGFLGRYLARGRESGMDAHLVDESGGVIASASRTATEPGRLPQALSAALQDAHGTYGHGKSERYFAAAPVRGSSWRMVVSEPTHDLYPILATGRTWLLWGVLLAFALTAAMSLFLFRRFLRTAAALSGANRRLEKRQKELALANEKLVQQRRLAEQASQAKSAFLANMSHELRTPLNAIIGFSELMMNGNGTAEAERKEYLGHVVASGRHLEQLVNDILDLSKVEAGKMEFHPQPVELPGLVGDVTDTMRVLADRKQIELDIDVAPEMPWAVVDPARFKQVLYNYLSNALKFTPEGGRVCIRIEPVQEGRFRLAVEDTGIGISLEDQQRLFHEFEQVDQTVRKEHQGTGLGLALVKRIVESQGGAVGVESTPGTGSVFYAELPRAPERAAGAGAKADQDGALARAVPAGGPNGRPTVLVVEDDRHDQALLEEILLSAGYVVTLAGNAADALAEARQRHFDVVVLDLILPDASGLEVLKTIREEGMNRSAQVIVVTMVKERGLGMAYAVNEWLVKPVDGGQLLAALERLELRPECGTVLVVDDDPSSRRLAEATIEQLGCAVVSAAGGEAGLAAAAEHRPLAAIVLDLLMPGVDGFQFLERLRSTADVGQTPVIVWTSRDLTSGEQAKLLQTAQALVGKSQRSSRLVDELKPFLADVAVTR